MKTGLCTLVFIGMAVPFKVMVLIPGLTEIRPVNAVPIVVGLLFGPEGALGCAVGNLVADLFGTFSAASVFGVLGNFTAAYLPYKIWYMNGNKELPNVKTNKNILRFIIIAIVSSLSVAVILSCGLDILNELWGKSIFLIVFLNDFGFSLFLGMPVFIVLTSEQLNISFTIPKAFIPSEKNILRKRVLFIMLVVSGIIFSFLVCMGIRFIESWVMIVSSIVFSMSAAAFMIKK
ncbi:ECF transporter S component [Clostridium sp. AWRP]|uniref:ECF transporter S component n=1 Tax=Clostridium sp. AWRP TaxID=2212991 RepID=UPI000FDBA879|nr:ECF transporter S component [Clostridium sp. AWRP]AZV56595.2 QueT transporter family protein [Clostridium sp. AWRP]